MKTKIIIAIVLILLVVGVLSCVCGTSSYLMVTSNEAQSSFYVGMGKEFLEQKDYDNALKYCKKGLEYDAKYPDGYYCLGMAYKETDEKELATENFQKALKYIENAVDEDLDFKVKQALKELGENGNPKK